MYVRDEKLILNYYFQGRVKPKGKKEEIYKYNKTEQAKDKHVKSRTKIVNVQKTFNKNASQLVLYSFMFYLKVINH